MKGRRRSRSLQGVPVVSTVYLSVHQCSFLTRTQLAPGREVVRVCNLVTHPCTSKLSVLPASSIIQNIDHRIVLRVSLSVRSVGLCMLSKAFKKSTKITTRGEFHKLSQCKYLVGASPIPLCFYSQWSSCLAEYGRRPC